MKSWMEPRYRPRQPPAKEQNPQGPGLRYRHRPLVNGPKLQRLPKFKHCCVSGCFVRVNKRTMLQFDLDVMVEGRRLPAGAWMCMRHHGHIYERESCTCGAALYALYGSHLVRGALRPSVSYIDATGQVHRSCPRCGADLSWEPARALPPHRDLLALPAPAPSPLPPPALDPPTPEHQGESGTQRP